MSDIQVYERLIEEFVEKKWYNELRMLAEELLGKVDKLQTLLKNLELNKTQETLSLLHEMPWMNHLTGPSGEVGDVFLVIRNDANRGEDRIVAEGNDLLIVLQAAKAKGWKG